VRAASVLLALAAGSLAPAQIIEFESGGLHYQTQTAAV
jgi:hypothetical protein